jgi:glycosyltransferase involved in cell wall biosynthesis
MSKPVILHCIDSLRIGGAEVLLRDTINGLEDYDHIVCYLRMPAPLLSSINAQYSYHLEHGSWRNLFSTRRKLKQIICKHQPDLLHAHLFEPTLIARLSAPKKLKFFFTIHNILSKDAFEVNRLSLIAEKLTYKKRQHIIAVSKEALNDYDEWVGIKGKADVLYNYVSQNFFDLQYNYDQQVNDSFRLVAVGNLRRQKNYPALLNAMELVKDIPVSLDIFGSGDMQKELQNTIDKNKLNVRLMGRVNDVSEILLNYHAYIMPSLFEGFGIAPMEAMASGMPVLLSNLSVFKELGNDIPLYFDPTNPESIANFIKYAYLNWNEVKAKAKKGEEFIYKKASRETYFVKLKEIYQSDF